MFVGQFLSYQQVGCAMEVRLHRDPCNEIGTVALREMEWLLDHLRSNQDYRALIWYSDRERGFSAGADLRELHAGLMERRAGSIGGRVLRKLPTRLRKRVAQPLIQREIGVFVDRIHRVFDGFDTLDRLTVAVTHGVVFGGGFELSLIHI